MVCIEACSEGVGEEGVDGGADAIEAPDLDGIEPEVCFRVAAVRVFVVAIPAAVVAQVDGVIVFHPKRLFGGLESALEDGAIACNVVAEEVG